MSESSTVSLAGGAGAADPNNAAAASPHMGTLGQPGAGKPSSAEQFQDIAERLSAATTPEAVYREAIHGAMSVLGAQAGVVLTQEAGQTELQTQLTCGELVGAPDVYAGTLLAGTPMARALGTSHEAFSELYFEHAGALAEAYPTFDWQGRLPPVACAFLVVRVPGEPVAVLVLEFREPHVFTAPERRLLRQLAGQCALTLSSLRSAEQLQTLVEERTRELNVLTLLATLLQQATEPEQTARLALERLGPALGVQGVALLRPQQVATQTMTGAPPPASLLAAPVMVWGQLPAPLLRRIQALGWPLGSPLPADLTRAGLQAVPMFSPAHALMGVLIAWNPPVPVPAPQDRLAAPAAPAPDAPAIMSPPSPLSSSG